MKPGDLVKYYHSPVFPIQNSNRLFGLILEEINASVAAMSPPAYLIMWDDGTRSVEHPNYLEASNEDYG